MEALTRGKRLYGTWYDRTAVYEASLAGHEYSPGDFATRYEVPLTPLPCLEHLSEKERREKIRELVISIQKETKARHREKGTSPLDKKKILRQHPYWQPGKTKRSPAPSCHCSDKETWKAFRDAYREFVSMYRAASRRLRRGDLNVKFPENSFRPALGFVGPATAPT